MCAHALMRALLYAIRAVGGRDACGRKRGGGAYLCPDNVDLHLNVPVESIPQIRTVLSSLPLARVPSSLHATEFTL